MAHNKIQHFSPETQISFRLPHAGPVDRNLTGLPGQEARKQTVGDSSSGDYAKLRDGRDAGGIRFKRPESRGFAKATRGSRLT